MSKALYYLTEQWPYLVKYLEDGRLGLRNNRAERSIKSFAMGKKNGLFAGGAQASSVIYSLIETAKENGLDSYRYLLWILQTAPKLSQGDENWVASLVPAHAPDEYKVSIGHDEVQGKVPWIFYMRVDATLTFLERFIREAVG